MFCLAAERSLRTEPSSSNAVEAGLVGTVAGTEPADLGIVVDTEAVGIEPAGLGIVDTEAAGTGSGIAGSGIVGFEAVEIVPADSVAFEIAPADSGIADSGIAGFEIAGFEIAGFDSAIAPVASSADSATAGFAVGENLSFQLKTRPTAWQQKGHPVLDSQDFFE